MLDIKFIRENPEFARERLASRGGAHAGQIDGLLELDAARRDIISRSESLKSQQNAVSKRIPELKKSGRSTDAVFSEMKVLADTVKELEKKQREIEDSLTLLLLSLPNLPDLRAPDGRDAEDNIEIRKSGSPREFSFEPKPHWELGESLSILDSASAAKVTGARFHFYRGMGAALERAVINFYLDIHTRKNGYFEILPPYIVNRTSMTGTGQLPKFEEDAFKLSNDDYFLIPTAEVPVTNIHRDEILDLSQLPIKYCAYSACFRAEAGSAGRDTRGLIRQHQFNKVELVKFCDPETSFSELESLTNDAEGVLKALGLPYRIMKLCSGDMGFASALTYDIEVWMPSYSRYLEISSCSNFTDFQARRANIRFRREKGGKPQFVHTLNGSGVAIGRTVAAIIENYQLADGTVEIPAALRPYMGGLDIIDRA